VEGLEALDYFEDAVDQGLAFAISEGAEVDAATEMSIVVGVASGAAERALTGDFDRQRWAVADEDFAPGSKDLRGSQARPFPNGRRAARRINSRLLSG
jgi:hypothetical protein